MSTTTAESDLWGNVYEIGGTPPRVVLRLRSGALFTATADEGVVSELRNQRLLHTDVGLIGTATWRLDDWSLAGFHATEVAGYRPDEQSLAEAFELLRRASQGRWDHVDAARFVDDLRS